MCNFFHEVKKNTGSISSSWFMNDIAPQFYNAWVGVMDECPHLQNLLCMWHVDKALTHELKKKLVKYQQNLRFTRCFEQFSNKLTTAYEVFSNALASPQNSIIQEILCTGVATMKRAMALLLQRWPCNQHAHVSGSLP